MSNVVHEMSAAGSERDLAWPWTRMIHGGDYNPEQWGEHVWDEDVQLMREAGVNLVSLAIFSWALLEPEPGTFDFGWLDRVMDLLDEGGIGVNLANATASPPPWMAALHPETLPVTATGVTLSPGGRQAYCPSSPVFRERAAMLTEQIAGRYGAHPALRMWHVGNEYGCHVSRCYCDGSAAAFRRWLQERYGSLDALNDAWGTNFWSQRYHRWEEVLPPRAAPTFPNPMQQLDFRRFSTHELIATYRAERAILERLTPTIPITTNFVIGSGFEPVDYWAFAPHVDVVAIDHYTDSDDPLAHVELAYCADVSRGLAGGRPWLLMEHSTSAVNWQQRNRPKAPGELIRNSVQHVARGADGAMFFQWRQSAAGAEKYHSAMVPHAGTDTKVWREVVTLGASLDRLEAVVGTTVESSVAMLYDWDSWWVNEITSRPSAAVTYPDRARALHRALWEAGITVDMVRPGSSLDSYRLVLVPTLTMVTDEAADVIERFVEAGGTALVTYFSGIVDEHDRVRLGGYPGAFRELLGIVTEEFHPLADGAVVELDDGARATLWAELTHLAGAEVVASYRTGPHVGSPAITRHTFGAGSAWYLGTRLEPDDLARLLDRITATSGVEPVVAGLPAGLEAVRRSGSEGSFVFLVNHGNRAVTVGLAGEDLLTGAGGRSLEVGPGAIAVVAEVIDQPSAQGSAGDERREQ